jgi:hypothetical protein
LACIQVRTSRWPSAHPKKAASAKPEIDDAICQRDSVEKPRTNWMTQADAPAQLRYMRTLRLDSSPFHSDIATNTQHPA